MASNIRIDQLANEITRAVKDYTEDVSRGIEKEVESTADLVLKEVKELAPRRIPEYYKHFTKTSKSKVFETYGNRKFYVWNKKHYRRVHLLEKGHAKVGGGRVDGIPHLIPAYDKHAQDMDKRIEQIVKKGG